MMTQLVKGRGWLGAALPFGSLVVSLLYDPRERLAFLGLLLLISAGVLYYLGRRWHGKPLFGSKDSPYGRIGGLEPRRFKWSDMLDEEFAASRAGNQTYYRSGQRRYITRQHSLLFIKLEYWGLIVALLAFVVILFA